jgi:hypothetical protein
VVFQCQIPGFYSAAHRNLPQVDFVLAGRHFFEALSAVLVHRCLSLAQEREKEEAETEKQKERTRR